MSLTFCGQPAPAKDKSYLINNNELTCLAKNIYWEARNQSFAGQVAVGLVTLNRVKDDRFPNTICEVVYQGPHRQSWANPDQLVPLRDKCHFSWYCDGLPDDIPSYDFTAYKTATEIAELMIDDSISFYDITQGATHYHADYVLPAWSQTKEITVEIDDHIFYKWN